MPKNNPSNPFATDTDEVEHIAPMAVARATVTESPSRVDDEGGLHRARIRIYGEPSPYTATVLTPSRGDVNAPTEGDDVAVIFGPNEQPYIIGFWYAANKVQDGTVNLPDYQPGERVIANPDTESYIRIDNDGDIHINSEDGADVFINGVAQ